MLKKSILFFSIVSLTTPGLAFAYVPIPVGGHKGELDLVLRLSLERGKIEPTENALSFQAADWNVYTLGAGFTIGDVAWLQDLFVRLDASYYASPAERNEKGVVAPTSCLGRVIDDHTCEFYPEDRGLLITPMVGFNLVHKPAYSFGVFLQGTIPIDVNTAKFALPRIDYIAGGLQMGVHLTDWFGFQSRFYIGSGAIGAEPNGAVAMTNLLSFEAPRWILPWKAGLNIGPYFEGDFTRRFDARYDAAFTTGYPAVRDRVQAMRFALASLPYFLVTDRVALEFGYVQKFFGYDPPATQLFTVAVRSVF